MSADKQGQTIAMIYDAALDGTRWDEALIAIADLLGSTQCALQIFNGRGNISGYAPMMDTDARRAYTNYWREAFPCWRKTSRYPVGHVFTLDHIEDRDSFQQTRLYREWWQPLNLGFDARGANLAADADRTALASVYKPNGEEFSSDERRLFDGLVEHLIRAVAIHRRLQIAELAAGRGADKAEAGFLVVDKDGLLLSDDSTACGRLAAAGFLVRAGTSRRIETPGRVLERMVAGQGSAAGGSCELHGRDGNVLRFTVVPVRESGGGQGHWLKIDRPAALIHVSAAGEKRQSMIDQLVGRHGLTPAEAAVAVEIARGDGRAAAGARLGIRETTVRSHLTTIFDKVGVHRQAELAQLVLSH